MPSLDVCRTEIEEHFEFLNRWRLGDLDDAAFERQERVSAPEFTVVAATGEVVDRDAVIEGVYDSYGEADDLTHEIRNVELVAAVDDHALVRYQVVIEEDGTTNRAIETALLRSDEEAPNDVVWVDLQETKIDT